MDSKIDLLLFYGTYLMWKVAVRCTHSLTHSLTHLLTHSLVLISVGETAFTHPYNTVGSTSDIECTLPLDVKTSIKVVPKKGNAIIFYSLTGDG